jgi:hypothetical protein
MNKVTGKENVNNNNNKLASTMTARQLQKAVHSTVETPFASNIHQTIDNVLISVPTIK